MGLLDRFRKSTPTPPSEPPLITGGQVGSRSDGQRVELGVAGLNVDGHLIAAASVSQLRQALGVPRLWHDEPVWDEFGLRASANGDTVSRLTLLLKESHLAGQMDPTHRFTGMLLIDGRDMSRGVTPALQSQAKVVYKDPRTKIKHLVLNVQSGGGGWKVTFVQISSEGEPFIDENVWIEPTGALAKPVSDNWMPGKFDQQPVKEPVATFSTRQLKLLVIDELMYNQDVLQPRFDAEEFCAHATPPIDIDVVGETEIPEVAAWFDALPVPARLLTGVTELTMDAGNEVLCQLIPRWNDVDTEQFDRYTLTSINDDDLAQLPNLKEVVSISLLELDDESKARLYRRRVTIR